MFATTLAAASLALTMMWPAAAGAATCSPTDFKNPDGSLDIAGYLQCSAPSVSDSVVAPGGTITFKGGGFAPNSVVTITLHSDPILLGTTTADSRGNFAFEAAIPADLPPGDHALEASGVDPSGNPLTVSQSITVVTAEVLGEVQTAGTSGTLPYTGADIARYAGLGLGLAVVGGAAVWGARRAKANQAA